MKQLIKKILRKRHYYKLHRTYTKQFKEAMVLNNIADKPCEGERQWLKRWSAFGVGINATQYRLFHHYIGSNMDIVPEEISNCFIEPVLNPEIQRGPYLDKNFFDKLMPNDWLPKTYLRKMNGLYFDRDYQSIKLTDSTLHDILSDATEIIVKPAFDSWWGTNVRAFFRNSDGHWMDSDKKNELCTAFLETEYGDDLIVQEKVRQNEFAANFNASSVNTIRLAVYRSVKDDGCHCVGAVMRVGGRGSVADNVHGGGHFIGIDSTNGKLHKKAYSQEGVGSDNFNGINFSDDIIIPEWEKIMEFGEKVCKQIPHHRLIALDIAISVNGPKLIEFNVCSYSTWLFQYTSGSALGLFADEILEHCLSKKSELIFKY